MAPPTPLPPSPHLPPDPEPPASRSAAAGADLGRAAARRRRYQTVVWGAIAAAIVLGLYFYFAHARALVPLRVGA